MTVKLEEGARLAIVMGLAVDASKEHIAKEAGCSVPTVYRYSRDEEIRELVRRVREDVVDGVAGMFTAMLPEAAVHLRATINDHHTQPAQRIAAIKLLFEALGVKSLVIKEPEEKGEGLHVTVGVYVIDPVTRVRRPLLEGEEIIEGTVVRRDEEAGG